MPGNDAVSISYLYYQDLHPFFRTLIFNLVDRNIYDLTPVAVPLTLNEEQFTGVTAPSTVVSIFLNGQMVTQSQSNVSGVYSFTLRLKKGKNVIYSQAVVGLTLMTSNKVYINTYDLYLWLAMYANEFEKLDIQLNETKLNIYLETATEDGIRKNFIPYTVQIPVDAFLSLSLYRQAVRLSLDSHLESTTILGIKKACNAVIGADPDEIIEYNQQTWLPMTGDLKVEQNGADPTLNYKWAGGQVYLGNKWRFVKNGTDVANDNASTFVYIDGSVNPDGYQMVKESLIAPVGTVFTLGKISALAGDITDIEEGKRIGNGGVFRSLDGSAFQFQVNISGGVGISAVLKDLLEELLTEVKPVHRVGFLKFDDEAFARTF